MKFIFTVLAVCFLLTGYCQQKITAINNTVSAINVNRTNQQMAGNGSPNGRMQGGRNPGSDAPADVIQPEKSVSISVLNRIPPNERYMYPEFTLGRVISYDKKVDTLRMNFDRYFSLMVGIDNDGDTALLKPFEGLKYVSIGNDLFYHNLKSGFLKFITDPNGTIKLVSRAWTKEIASGFVESSKPGSMPAGRFEVIAPMDSSTRQSYRVVLERKTTIFVMGPDGNLLPSRRKTYINLYPDHKKMIIRYLHELSRQRTTARFDDEADMVALLQFCSRVDKIYKSN